MAGGTSDWITPVGSLLSRDERMTLYGGAKYGGIEPSRSTPNVFVYSDPDRGEAFGYRFDGWADDGSRFLFTGEGRVGDQEMREGNRAILEHAANGRALRVFVADGFVDGSGSKNHRYVGAFRVDETQPFVREDAPDVNGDLRSVIVFRLSPDGPVHHREDDASQVDDIPKAAQVAAIELESNVATTFETPGSAPSTATKREAELVESLRDSLNGLGHVVRRWRIRPACELRALYTDLYDETAHELYEAKGVATRNAVRMAVGQLLDYRRHIPDPERLELLVLLPVRPSDDLLSFVLGLGISCTYPTGSRTFARIEPV